MNRRDFLLLRAGPSAVLSCEQLYMRWVDACADGTTARLFEHLASDLRGIHDVRLTETTWLSCEDLKRQLDAVFDAYRKDGGRIEQQ